MENLDLFNGINATSIALLTFAVIGFVTLYKAIYKQDWETAGIIIVAGAAGAILSPFVPVKDGIEQITWFIGMLIGFAGSGVITTASYFGSKSAVQVDKANVVNSETVAVTKKSRNA